MTSGTQHQLRTPWSLVNDWLQGSLYLVVGVAGVVLIVLGLKRDDIVRPIFLIAGVALAALGFGAQFLGWRL